MEARSRMSAALCAVVLATGLPAIGIGEEHGAEQALRLELEALQQRLRALEERLERQEAECRALAREAPSPSPSPAAATEKPSEPWFPGRAIVLSGPRGYLNLSFDALVDLGWSTQSTVGKLQRGDHDPRQRGFSLPNEELVLEGAIDPYFKGVADIVFKLDDDNETEVELEEVYLTSLSLPWNLQAKGGQFFTEFGRLNQQHPHAWDFVDQPLVMGRMFGPEGLRNPGVRLSWLVPTPFYSELFAAVQNSHGGTASSFRNGEEDLFGRPAVERGVRDPGDLLWVPRYVASFDLSDAQTLVTGISAAIGPNASSKRTRTEIYGADVYWKWKPAWQMAGFPFVSWQTEILGRRYEAGAATLEDGTILPRETLYDWGAYSQILYGFRRRWVAGLRADWVSGDEGVFRRDEHRSDRFRMAPNLTFHPTEFSKLRLQYNFDRGQLLGDDSSVWLQTEFLLGSHGAHEF